MKSAVGLKTKGLAPRAIGSGVAWGARAPLEFGGSQKRTERGIDNLIHY